MQDSSNDAEVNGSVGGHFVVEEHRNQRYKGVVCDLDVEVNDCLGSCQCELEILELGLMADMHRRWEDGHRSIWGEFLG